MIVNLISLSNATTANEHVGRRNIGYPGRFGLGRELAIHPHMNGTTWET